MMVCLYTAQQIEFHEFEMQISKGEGRKGNERMSQIDIQHDQHGIVSYR